jgi:predicted nucleic acid-binding protein
MKRVGVDTNVIVSFLTDRDPTQQAWAAQLFAAAAAGEHVVVLPQSVISEAVYVMCNVYDAKPGAVSALLRDVLSLPGVVRVDELDWPAVFSLWPRRVKNFGDACLAAVARAGAFDALATFDAAFAKRARRLGLATHW